MLLFPFILMLPEKGKQQGSKVFFAQPRQFNGAFGYLDTFTNHLIRCVASHTHRLENVDYKLGQVWKDVIHIEGNIRKHEWEFHGVKVTKNSVE